MFALVSPNEPAFTNGLNPVPIGQRVAEVSAMAFPVAAPLFWVACSVEVVADQYYYDPADQQIKPKP